MPKRDKTPKAEWLQGLSLLNRYEISSIAVCSPSMIVPSGSCI
jgi:hypothetical protein